MIFFGGHRIIVTHRQSVEAFRFRDPDMILPAAGVEHGFDKFHIVQTDPASAAAALPPHTTVTVNHSIPDFAQGKLDQIIRRVMGLPEDRAGALRPIYHRSRRAEPVGWALARPFCRLGLDPALRW